MADELKTEDNIVTPTTEGGDSQVTMSQEKLDSLINGKFAKGAEKATNELLASLGVENIDSLKSIITTQKEQEEASKSDLEKAQETINKLTEDLNISTSSMQKMQEANELSSLALQNGVQDVDYFKFAYENAKNSEGFKLDEFMEKLKTDKPFVFNPTVIPTPKVDQSPNNGNPADFAERVKKATTKEDMDALYKELGQ